ncbi:MAG TPA: DoxX family protein [Candidatus Paceibacterota bacterium]|nr:DoxX family protein [Candidatus Paceibacterota bacterium]
MSTLLFWYGGLGFVIPRIVLGALLIVHGWSKIKDLRQNAKNFSGMGFKPGALWGTIAALLEFFGGIGLVLGLWVPYLALLFMIQFAVIIVWKWSKRMPFVGGWEIDALIFVFFLMFFTLYGGFFLFATGGL